MAHDRTRNFEAECKARMQTLKKQGKYKKPW